MAPAPQTRALTEPSASLVPGFGWPTDLSMALLRLQRLQFDQLIAWQRSVAAMQQELWDEWVCRFAGGAPIDV